MDQKFELINDDELMNIKLTYEELIFIDDRLTLGMDSSGFQGILPIRVPKREECVVAHLGMICRIGGYLNAFIKNEDEVKNNTIEASFCASDLLLLREIAQSDAEINRIKIGLPLKLKINKALFSFEKKGVWKVIEEFNNSL